MASLNVHINPSGAVAGAATYNKSIDSIRRSTRRAARDTRVLASGFDRIKRSVFSLQGAFVGFSAVAVFGSAISSIKDFEHAMAATRAVTGATGRDFDALERKAKALGATTLFSASEAAEGMKFLGMAGFRTNEILATIKPSLDLAVAGSLSLAESADIASNVLLQFNLAVSETEHVADVLAQTASSTNTSVAQMAEAMSAVGPVAQTLGISMEETGAAIGVLGNAGIQGSKAGFQLRQILLALVDATGPAAETIRAMGLDLGDLKDTLKTGGLAALFDELAKKELEAGEAARIFQRRASPGVLVLVRQIEKLRELTKANEDSAGAVKKMADIMADDLFGAFKQFTSATEAVYLELGTGDSGLSGALKSVLYQATGLFRVWAGMSDTLGEDRQHFERVADAIEGVSIAAAALVAIKLNVYFARVSGEATVAAAAHLRLFAAQTAAAKSATALAGATRMLSRGFKLLGGPAGLIMLAAEAMLFWSWKTDDASAATDKLMDKVDDLIRSYDKVGTAAAVAARDELEAAIAIEYTAIDKLEDRLEKFREHQERIQQNPTAYGPAADTTIKVQIAEMEESIKLRKSDIEIMETQLAVVDRRIVQIQEEGEELDELNRKLGENTEAVRTNAEEIDAAEKRARDAYEGTRTQLEVYKATVAELDAMLEKWDESKGLDENLKAGAINAEIYARAVEQAKEAIDGVTEAQEAAKTETEKLNEAWEYFNELVREGILTQQEAAAAVEALKTSLEKEAAELEKVQDTAEDAGETMLKAFSSAATGAKDWDDAMKGAIAQIVEMVAQLLILKPLMESFKDILSGGGGGGGGGFLGSFLSNLGGSLFGGSFAGGAVDTGGLFGGASFTPNAVDFNMGSLGGFSNIAAEGAVVKPRPGGSLLLAGEAGEPEMVLPLSKAKDFGFGGGGGGREPQVNITITTPPGHTAETRESRNGSSRDIEIMVKKIVAQDVRNKGEIMQGVNRNITGPVR